MECVEYEKVEFLEVDEASLERCKRRLNKMQANAKFIVQKFLTGSGVYTVFLSVDDIKVQLVHGTAYVKDLDRVGTFPAGIHGLKRLIARLNERA